MLAPHFYELAARALDLFDEDDIVEVLMQVRFFRVFSRRQTFEEGRLV